MADTQLEVAVRDSAGKGAARKLRAAGRIPGVCYGHGDSLNVALDAHALERLLQKSEAGMNTLFDVKGVGALEGKKVILKELQRDPVTHEPLHADLYAVDLTEMLEVSVPIHLEGVAEGVRLEGGILDQALREVELECLPTNIPKEIRVDVTSLTLGDSLHVRDLPLPEGVTLVSDEDLSVVSVVQPAAAEAEEAAEAAEVAEGEVPVEGAEPAEGEEKPAEESSGD